MIRLTDAELTLPHAVDPASILPTPRGETTPLPPLGRLVGYLRAMGWTRGADHDTWRTPDDEEVDGSAAMAWAERDLWAWVNVRY